MASWPQGELVLKDLLGPFRTSARPYLLMLVMAVLFAQVAHYVWQYIWLEFPEFYGQPPGVYVKIVFIGFSLGFWLLYKGSRTTNPYLIAFFITLLVLWLSAWLIARYHVDALTYDVALYPLVILALLFKTPRPSDVRFAIIALAWLLVVILFAARLLEITDVITTVDVGPELLKFEQERYWLPLSGSIGPEGRWVGPLGHNSLTGNAAAMVLVVAVGVRGRTGLVFALVAILTLLLTASRGSILAAIAGILALAIFSENFLTRRISRKWIILSLPSILAAVGVSLFLQSPNLTGRLGFWAYAIDVWQQRPWFGVGSSGKLVPNESPAPLSAHNLFFDALLKGGAVIAVLVTIALLLAVVIAIRGARTTYGPLALGILVAYLVIGSAQSDQWWLGASLPWLWLMLAVTLAGSQPEEERSAANTKLHAQ